MNRRERVLELKSIKWKSWASRNCIGFIKSIHLRQAKQSARYLNGDMNCSTNYSGCLGFTSSLRCKDSVKQVEFIPAAPSIHPILPTSVSPPPLMSSVTHSQLHIFQVIIDDKRRHQSNPGSIQASQTNKTATAMPLLHLSGYGSCSLSRVKVSKNGGQNHSV
ncbi:hypothetical protein TWF569_003019 [Orbilia oligospora]|uniref:Uncharacterized protein n=1 Tax=Orbilia oligospora TaxID=2813651 RepID=A0A7C8NVT0_ORBOL|nr:hypothetical protein TWF102_007051 [Orbilia oligospora]KAF3114319.1 hypothetical protein TWF706_008254 [Orbilia oligospora]KAF3117207.1 hypothetical protein TWF103_007356 [Orbilia oligospora]KAF3150007.1 hypothetical protein TWF594_009913 [Orbilia oligospora]KAF3152721.1 hypothetical protein TWF569_003019 [Orbilia oligospora]